MANLILACFLIVLISLNVLFFNLSKKEQLSLMVSGLILIGLAPLVNFTMRGLFLYFYDWSSGGTGEGAGYGGAILALVTFVNGLFLLVLGFNKWLFTIIKKN
ncbi:inner-membrane translocator [Planomicrobium chinense]|uniref:inner-membrane translocator n=1 Tax=Planococcus chinensis TaxID=272917 RepID=UPI001CC6A94C|nr:inner-membrane translocator [Planococcus chinensis]MBZ5201744.1 inner-membrane translocator [Planococcus chinensis]